MDERAFLQALRDLPPQEGRVFLQEHRAELTDHAATGKLIKDEALRQRNIHPFTSLKLAELLIFFGEDVQHDPSRALGLAAKGDALSMIGHEQAAMEALDEAGMLFLRLDDEINWARTRVSWLISCAWLGRVEEALQAAARAREVFARHNERYWICAIDHNTAVVYTQSGHYHKALEIYERISQIYPLLHEYDEEFITRAIAMVKVNQARNLAWLGNFEQARKLLYEALASFKSLEQIGYVHKTEINLADLDYAQGYYGSALRRYYQVYDREKQDQWDDSSLADIMLRISSCLIKLNRIQEAYQLATSAVAIYRQLHLPLETGLALQELAVILVASGRMKDALLMLDEASQLFERGSFGHYVTANQLKQLELLVETGAYDQAYAKAEQLKASFEVQGLVTRAIRTDLVMASALVAQIQQARANNTEISPSHFHQAINQCEHIIALAAEQHLQEEMYKSHHLLGKLAMLREELDEAERYYRASIERVESILDDLVLDSRPTFLHSTWKIYEDMIALSLERKQIEKAFHYLERARSLALRQYLGRSRGPARENNHDEAALLARNASVLRMRSELNEWQQRHHFYSTQLAHFDNSASPSIDQEVFKAELKRSEEKISELFERLHLIQFADYSSSPPHPSEETIARDEPPAIEDVKRWQRYLLPDQLLLAYFLYKERLVIFVLTNEHLVSYEQREGLALLEKFIPPLYARLETRGWANPQQPPHLPTRRILQKLYDVLIAPAADYLPPPSGAITIVPYGSLHSLPFHALYNGDHFLAEDYRINYLPASSFLDHLHNDKRVVAKAAPLVLGYSDKGTLPRALTEAQTLAAMLNGHCYLEQEATIERLLQEAANRPLIHLATHGQRRLDAPNFSYVRLADGQLNAIDAFSLNLEGCELITLSGCETGLALSSGGDEQLGLGRAFLAAGVPSLVMSLWPVEDNATNELMQVFYEHLLRGESKVQALRAAQHHMLHHTSTQYAHPYFWAAFRLVGDIGPLKHM